jgi:hypothetical protein
MAVMRKNKRVIRKDRKTRRKGKVLLKHQRSVYLYWYKFLKFAVDSGELVKWSKYKKWKIKEEISITKFDDWFDKHQHLFAIEKPGDNPIVRTSTNQVRPEAYKKRLKVLELKHSGLTHEQIFEKTREGITQKFTRYIAVNNPQDSAKILMRARKHLKNVINGTFP